MQTRQIVTAINAAVGARGKNPPQMKGNHDALNALQF
jgi:hypothetical protein